MINFSKLVCKTLRRIMTGIIRDVLTCKNCSWFVFTSDFLREKPALINFVFHYAICRPPRYHLLNGNARLLWAPYAKVCHIHHTVSDVRAQHIAASIMHAPRNTVEACLYYLLLVNRVRRHSQRNFQKRIKDLVKQPWLSFFAKIINGF